MITSFVREMAVDGTHYINVLGSFLQLSSAIEGSTTTFWIIWYGRTEPSKTNMAKVEHYTGTGLVG